MKDKTKKRVFTANEKDTGFKMKARNIISALIERVVAIVQFGTRIWKLNEEGSLPQWIGN